jgi:menaquinol-cytochrome c reductase iron-sulfur subunit
MSTEIESGHLSPIQAAATAPTALPAHRAPVARNSRRSFLFKVALALNGAVGAVLAVPIVGYLLGPALKRDHDYKSWLALGSIGDFPEGETRLVDYRNPVTTGADGATGNVACWVRHVQGSQFQVFAINCAHLGCPVRWFPQSHLFMCPCHGGAYYEDGSRASGPPERGLFEYQYSIVSGKLMIDAGQMPTLSNRACNQKPLIQIAPNPSAPTQEENA